MGFDTTSEITFRKLSIFMTFMEKGNIARTAETLGLAVSACNARCIPSKSGRPLPALCSQRA